MVLIVFIRVPHHRPRVSGYNAICRTNWVCVAIVAESRNRQVLGSNIKVCEVPAEGDWLIWGNLEVGCRCLCWLGDRQPTSSCRLGDAVKICDQSGVRHSIYFTGANLAEDDDELDCGGRVGVAIAGLGCRGR